MNTLLSLSDVSVALGEIHALGGVSLNVEPGRIVALLGPNGAGKTTCIRVGLGLIEPAAGSALLGGAAAAKLSPRQRALRAAYLPQRPQAAWPVTVEHLVALGRFAYGAAPERLSGADAAAVDAAIAACTLDPLRKRRMDQISGGERLRAHIARTLAQGAPLLMLDEPTAGLDPAQSLSVAEILRAHATAGGAALVATHDLALAARLADHVLLLRGGRVLAEGAPRQALTPDAIEATYERKGKLTEIEGRLVALFD